MQTHFPDTVPETSNNAFDENDPLQQCKGRVLRLTLQEQWLSQNRAAIEAYNQHIEKDGVFSAGLRSF